MCDIKLIKKDTDFFKLKFELMPWDSWYGDNPLDVYRIDGYIHSIGGRWGNNNYWCCLRGQKPAFDNLMEFSGHPCNWGINIIENNYHKYKWEQHEINRSIRVEIIRNSKVFYSFVVNDFDYGLSQSRILLFEVLEHPIQFNNVNFEKDIIGRKILWKQKPCIIKDYSMNNNLIICPDKGYKKYFKNYEDETVVDCLFSPAISWFRECP